MQADRIQAVRRVVHDYARLISAGELMQEARNPPLDKNVQIVFWVSCRRMAKFFGASKKDNPFPLPVWNRSKEAIAKQLSHLRTTGRVDQDELDFSDAKSLLDEFRGVWRRFLGQMQPSARTEYETEIARRETDVAFSHLNLH